MADWIFVQPAVFDKSWCHKQLKLCEVEEVRRTEFHWNFQAPMREIVIIARQSYWRYWALSKLEFLIGCLRTALERVSFSFGTFNIQNRNIWCLFFPPVANKVDVEVFAEIFQDLIMESNSYYGAELQQLWESATDGIIANLADAAENWRLKDLQNELLSNCKSQNTWNEIKIIFLLLL